MDITRTTALVLILYCLHNFCIDAQIEDVEEYYRDNYHILMGGGICLHPSPLGMNYMTHENMLHDREYFNDIN